MNLNPLNISSYRSLSQKAKSNIIGHQDVMKYYENFNFIKNMKK